MSTEQTTEGQDVFDDTDSSASSNELSFTTEDGKGNTTEEDDGADTTEGGEGEQTGDKTSGTPPENEDDLEAVVDAKGQKMIPEHRFKAALKSATERAEKAERENAELTTPKIEVPDKATDPEGHSRHVRMEASVQVMREMKPDYQEVINHYATLAKDNPLLDQAVDGHALPAKLAYDIAKEDLRLKELRALADSDELKEFREWKKNKDTTPPADNTLNKKVGRGLQAVPNLNRSTNASPNRNVRAKSNGDNDDKLFEGAL